MTNEAQTAAMPAAAVVDMVTLLSALGNPVRWRVLRMRATEGHGFFSAP
jgi:hypothetical protein